MRSAVLAVFLWACRANSAVRQPGDGADSASPGGAMIVAADTSFPTPRTGELMARSVEPSGLAGTWQPRAGVCQEPPSFHLLARGDSVDVLIVLQYPPDSAGPGVYPVREPGDTATAGRRALVGAQRLRFVDVAYQGTGGYVELDRLQGWASGRFDVRLRDVAASNEIRYLGAFDRVPLVALDAATCRPAG